MLDDLNEFVNDSSSRIKPRQSFSFSSNEIDEFVNDSSSRMKSRSTFSLLENEKHNNLININEFNKIKVKTKKKFRKSQNKKNRMTKAKKKAINFTKRNFSSFELVERDIETRVKRVKKQIASKQKAKTSKFTFQFTRNRENREIRNEGEVKKVTRSIKTVSQIIFISNNEKNDNGFDNFHLNNDEDFDVFENENEITKND